MSQNPTVYKVPRTVATELASNIPVQMDDVLLLLNPNENPFTLMSTQVPKRKVGNDTYLWHDDEIVPEYSTLSSSSAAISSGASNTGTWNVGDGTLFAPWDVVKNMSTGSIGQVTAVSSNALTVSAPFGAIVAGASGDVIRRLGNSMEEGGGIPKAKSTAHTERTNYIQGFSDPVRFTDMAKNADDYFGGFGKDYIRQHKKALIQHARHIEWAFLMNEAPTQATPNTSITDPADEGNTMGLTMGLKYYIETYAPNDNNRTEPALAKREFYDWLEPCFEYGADTKFLFASPYLLQALMQWGLADVRFQASRKKQTLGLNFAEVVTPHGLVKLINHKMLKARSTTSDHYAFLVDFSDEKIKYVFYSGLDTQILRDQVKTGLKQTVDDVYTRCGTQFRLAECHGILKFKDYTA